MLSAIRSRAAAHAANKTTLLAEIAGRVFRLCYAIGVQNQTVLRFYCGLMDRVMSENQISLKTRDIFRKLVSQANADVTGDVTVCYLPAKVR
jgi:hypothetical protein